MSLHLSNSLPALRLNFSRGDFNEYRFRQGCVEFRTNDGPWRLLDEADIRLHFVSARRAMDKTREMVERRQAAIASEAVQ